MAQQNPPPEKYPAGYSQPPPPAYSDPAAQPPQQGYSQPPPPQGGAPPPGYPPQPGYGQPAYGQPAYGQPMPAGYAQQSATNTTVVMAPTGGPVIMQAAVFDSTSVAMTCPHCQAQISTSVSYRVGLMAWLICLGLAFFGLWLCSFIPFCIPDCKDIVHHCPNCSRMLGEKKRM